MTAQSRFNELYISSTEIMNDLGISRTSLSNARRTGKLKDPITLHNGLVVLYERTPELMEYVAAWKQILKARRNV